MLKMNLIIAVCLAGLVAARCVAGYPKLERVRRCTDGDCGVYIGGRNSGRIAGAHRVYEGGNPQGGSYGGSGYGSYNSGNQWYPQQQGTGGSGYGSQGGYCAQLSRDIQADVRPNLAQAANDAYNSGNQWYPQQQQQQGSGPGHQGSYETPQYGQPQPNRDNVYVPGNNHRNINL